MKEDKKKKKGVPRGYVHNWKYVGKWNEKKTGPGTWHIDFKATKRKKAEKGGPPKGFKIHWKINADQYAVKTGKGKYQTRMIGTKKLISKKTPNKEKKWQ